MKNLFKILFILFTIPAIAQQMAIDWQSSLGGVKNEDAFDLIQTTDGGYIIVGATNSKNSLDVGDSKAFEGTGGSDFWVVKTDNNGALVWSKTFGGSNDDVATSITKASNGEYVIVGTTYSTDGDANFNGTNGGLLMVRIKLNGDVVSKRVFAGGRRFTEFTYQFTDNQSKPVIRTLANGDLMLAATREIGSTDYRAKEFFLSRLTPTGDTLWEKTFGTKSNDFLADMILTSDGNVLLIGCTEAQSNEMVGAGNGFQDFLAIKTSQSGIEMWRKAWGGSNIDVLRSALENSTKTGYIIAGESTSKNGFINSNLGSKDGFIFRITTSGEVSWKMPVGGINNDGIYRLIPVGTSLYMGLGTSDSEIANLTQKGPLTDVFTIIFDDIGQIDNYGLFGGEDIDVARAGIAISDKEWVLAGLSRSESGDLKINKGNSDVWVFKLLPPLPITFKSFIANLNETNHAVVDFVTTFQQNAKIITLEKSLDNRNFSKLQDFTASQDLFTAKKYSFTDKNIQFGNNYYRIVFYDNANKQYYGPKLTFEYLPLAIAPNLEETNNIRLYPNPVTNFVQVSLLDADAELMIFDQRGLPFTAIKTYSFSDGWRIRFQKQPNPGMYILKIKSQNKFSARKFYVH